MDYAIIRLGGRQFTVQEGTQIKLERQENPVAEVILVSLGGELAIGTPVLTDYTVEIEKKEDTRDSKIRIGRYRAKSRYRRVKGHKQPISIIEIKSIIKGGKKVALPKAEKSEPIEVQKVEIVKEKVKAVKAEKVVKAPKAEKTEKAVVKKVAKVKVEGEAPKAKGRPKKVQE